MNLLTRPIVLWQYKLLSLLWYHEGLPGINRTANEVTMDIKPVAKYLGQRVYRIRNCLVALEEVGIVYDLSLQEHFAEFTILVPGGLKLDNQIKVQYNAAKGESYGNY